MARSPLPDPISQLLTGLQLVELEWRHRTLQIPKFSVYAILDTPVFDHYFRRRGRKMGLILQGRYSIPVLDPFFGDIEQPPAHVVIISHVRGNQFGLFGYPADRVRDNLLLSARHQAVPRIVQAFC
ncbi:hypothetical protein HMF8227_00505 [Saliniradius amylolyticus]|uniref:Uncharacterized protein n=1 Tax=Saliniradius amylolyticus TaxID=2183582 RepID=A0A2S2E029_9ALTE|nr:hypothetical protein [Saliniradius amylolyticus]AWL11001.1 hypothetical protein HMF8227_00505 [Saliniradius amylolyticus]